MFLQLLEIEKLIENFDGQNRDELASYFIKITKERLEDVEPFDNKKLELLKSALKVMNEKEHLHFICESLSFKILQMRALVLDLITTNYSSEQQYIYKPEVWIESIIRDVCETFEIKGNCKKTDVNRTNLEILNHYNRMLCEELLMIFCSCEKFNTSGNQLLLNIVAYINQIGVYVEYDFSDFIKKIYDRFNHGKAVPLTKIEDVYKEYITSASKKFHKKNDDINQLQTK